MERIHPLVLCGQGRCGWEFWEMRDINMIGLYILLAGEDSQCLWLSQKNTLLRQLECAHRKQTEF